MEDTSTDQKRWHSLSISSSHSRPSFKTEYLTLSSRLTMIAQHNGGKMDWMLLPEGFSALTQDVELFSSVLKMVKRDFHVPRCIQSTSRRPTSTECISWMDKCSTYPRNVKEEE